MGRCQSGFCSTKIVEILSRELNITKTDIVKNREESRVLIGKNKTL